ncbi:unnamed protein product [Rotaria sordida]|uniref:Uncharacterized protein n=1 Tax=Rotaria sordida TaxID=392033 RepID=A0A819EAH8_9BILA|nr:unnamed protein product [Rotaria sordida]
MFWECHVVTSSIDKLLDQPSDSINLQDFLDENDLIQECLTQNNRLLDYLVQGHIMNELIGYIIKNPIDNNFHNAQIVSELLSGDFQRIQDKLLEKEHLDLLYSFLFSNEINKLSTVNPILASYFSRIIMTLVIRKPNELINYFKTRETFKDDFFRHLDSTSITDVLYRLIADCGDQRSEAIKWYEDINLIDGLIQQLLITESTYTQTNIVNLLGEFIRLAFDQHNGIDNDFQRNIDTTLSSSTMECLPHNANENDEELSPFNRISSDNDTEDTSTDNQTDDKFTPLILAQHILSKTNLEKLFDTLNKQPILVANGCDFLITVFDLLSRYISLPQCIPLTSFIEGKSILINEISPSDKEETEQMQINDEGDTLQVIKSRERSSDETNADALKNLLANVKDPRIQIYSILLEVIPSRLPSLIALLSNPSAPLIPSSPSQDNSQTVKYQFISEPLGAIRLNLIKFFSKLIHTISNDYTGDYIYQILNSNRLFYILIDLFYHHIYNNFLHTQVYLILRLIFHINSLAVKQPNDIWTRLPLNDQLKSSESELPNSSSFHYTNRCSYKLFQSLLNSSQVNLIERLLDQYELNIASSKSILTSSSSDDAITSSLLHTRFTSPNSGHVAQILRCLREYATIFDNYSKFLKNNDQQQIDENTNILEIRWETALDYLNEDEKKCSAMHHHEQNSTNCFRLNSSVNAMTHINNVFNSNDSSEANQRRQTFHKRSFGSSGAPYIDDDDDDDDEVERFDIDDELMNNEQTAGERKLAEMKKVSFEPQFPPVFDEQSLWHQQDDTDMIKTHHDNEDNDNMKMTSAPPLPDLFENYRKQQEKSASSTESSFEQLCSLRANDHGSGPSIFPFQSSSSTVRDEVEEGQDEY